MFESTKVHLSADAKDLSCPICFYAFGLAENQPISTSCGHTICSICFGKITKCPFCKVKFDKTKRHQKSVFITSLIENSAKINTCKKHSEICQGFCLQDATFVCFDCLMKNHQGHKIITIKEINEKAKKIAVAAQKVQEKKSLRFIEMKNMLETEGKRQKRQLDEIIDQEISQLSMLKKKLYKDVDIRIISEQEHYEHEILSKNSSSKESEEILESWNKNPEANLALQIIEAPLEEQIKEFESFENQASTKIVKSQQFSFKEISENLNSTISDFSATFQKLFTPIIPTQEFSQIELDYLINVFQEYNLLASIKNGILQLKPDDPPIYSTSKFDPSFFTCSLSQISLNCPDILPTQNLLTICQILENIQALKDISIQLDKITTPDFDLLSNLILNLKALEKFSFSTTDLTSVPTLTVRAFLQQIIHMKKLSSLDFQHKNLNTIISFNLLPSSIFAEPLEALQEISLDLEGIPEAICEILEIINSNQAKSLKTLRLSLGKTPYNPKVWELVCKTLRLQNAFEELELRCEELNDSTRSDLLLFLSLLPQKKKLGIFVNKVSLSRNHSPTSFLLTCFNDLEEFTLKIKCGPERNSHENFDFLIAFLLASKTLKKFYLQFDGIYLTYHPTEKLFNQIVKLHTLRSLEIQFLNFSSFSPEAEKDLEAILNELPAHVTKKCSFSRPARENNLMSISDEELSSSEEESEELEENGSDFEQSGQEFLPVEGFFEFYREE